MEPNLMAVSSKDLIDSISDLIKVNEQKELQKMNMFIQLNQMKANRDMQILNHQLKRAERKTDLLYEDYTKKKAIFEEMSNTQYQLNSQDKTEGFSSATNDVNISHLNKMQNILKEAVNEKKSYQSGIIDLNNKIRKLNTIKGFYEGYGSSYKGGSSPTAWDVEDFSDEEFAKFAKTQPNLTGVLKEDWVRGAKVKNKLAIPQIVAGLEKLRVASLNEKIKKDKLTTEHSLKQVELIEKLNELGLDPDSFMNSSLSSAGNMMFGNLRKNPYNKAWQKKYSNLASTINSYKGYSAKGAPSFSKGIDEDVGRVLGFASIVDKPENITYGNYDSIKSKIGADLLSLAEIGGMDDFDTAEQVLSYFKDSSWDDQPDKAYSGLEFDDDDIVEGRSLTIFKNYIDLYEHMHRADIEFEKPLNKPIPPP